MSTYTQYSQAWLEDQDSIKIIVAVAQVYNVLTAQEQSLYLSNGNFSLGDGTVFNAAIRRDITLSETLSQDGSGAMTFGDIEVGNPNGEFDAWLDSAKYIWSNRDLKIYYADPQWTVSNLTDLAAKALLIFNGVIDDVDSRSKATVNLKIRDKLERLNAPLTEDKLGTYGTWSASGGQQNQDAVKPVIFGEVFNTTPLLLDPAKLKYMFNNGITESLIEIRDNGMPLATATEVSGFAVTISTTNGVVTGTSTITSPGSGFVLDDQVYVDESGQNFLTAKAVFTGNLSGTVLTVTSVLSGSLNAGMTITGSGITAGTTIASLGTGTGNTGTYNLSLSAATANAVSLQGLNAQAILTVTGVNAGGVTSVSIASGGTGYTGGVKSTGLHGIATSRTVNAVDSTKGIFLLAYQPSGTITCSVQGVKKTVNLTTGAVTNSYTNNIAQLIGLIVTQYGKASTRFTNTDLDSTNLNSFSTGNTQGVGAVVADTTNVLTVCRVLAGSVGAQLFVSRAGLLKLLKFGVGFAGSIIQITEADMLFNTMNVSRRIPLRGTVKLGYAKNYTVQPGLQTSIASSHKDTMAEEWLTTTVLNTEKILRYELSQDAQQQDTNLIASLDAQAEAQRLLDYYSVQRTVYRFTGTPRLLGLELGQTVTLIHSRFNLYNSGLGYSGQVISLTPNWTTGKVEVEVII